jgi:chemotaxis protein methyltransferase CheR
MDIFATKKLTDEDFLFFREKIFVISGINLNDAKRTLVQTRLNSHLDRLQIKTFAEYRVYLEKLPVNDPEHQSFVNLLTTNKTEWFREIEHFNYLISQFIPKWKKLGKKTLTVWSAASSSGEEAYTIALVLEKLLDKTGIDYQIIGSDIDTNVLSYAQNGVYKREHLSVIPDEYHCYFDMGTKEITEWMKVGKKIKAHVTFQPFNLKTGNYQKMNQSFDLIFCRNVMIYFTPDIITKVAQGCLEVAAPDAVLIISHSESMQNLKTAWKILKPSVYVKGINYL